MSVIRHKKNPFLSNMVIPVKSRQVRLSRLGKDDNILINQQTGEILGTHVTTYRPADAAQFVKIFTTNIAMAFDLTTAGIKALTVLISAVQKNALGKDEVTLDAFTLDDFLMEQIAKKLSLSTFKRGISELEKAQIIAKTIRKGRYFINPNFVFNGDRIAFTTVIHRINSQYEQEQEEKKDISL